MGLRVEDRVYFHSDDEIADYTKRALAIADELGLSDVDRSTLLPKLVELVSAGHMSVEQVGIATGPLMQIPRG